MIVEKVNARGLNDRQSEAITAFLTETFGFDQSIDRGERPFDPMSSRHGTSMQIFLTTDLASWAIQNLNRPSALQEIPQIFGTIFKLFRANLEPEAIEFEQAHPYESMAGISTEVYTPLYYMHSSDIASTPLTAWDQFAKLQPAIQKEQAKLSKTQQYQARWSSMKSDWQFHTYGGWKYLSEFED